MHDRSLSFRDLKKRQQSLTASVGHWQGACAVAAGLALEAEAFLQQPAAPQLPPAAVVSCHAR